MAHRRQADAYDYLATSKVSELTVAQLEQALENSFLNKSNIEFWKGPIVMHKLLEVSRTYPGAGVPIPEQSEVATQVVDASSFKVIQPPGTEIWDVLNIRAVGMGGEATATISWTDGANDSDINVAAAIPAIGTNVDLNGSVSGPRRLTNTCYLKVAETGGVFSIGLFVAYHKVSM